ncbi:hypothetical protein CCC_02272 [Paramagnetospirillum magnetotacticum MS-1]|uniref:Uncharacterized protein n=1 Tax=Paramagnetospirillum magnetotacticum MS-1 TaxID=272627 RepID=A0A0C2UBF1_PARME|nr:hypothetical protein CCC_02272 [Paramagnetospirillum magnetotacticum MS-1]
MRRRRERGQRNLPIGFKRATRIWGGHRSTRAHATRYRVPRQPEARLGSAGSTAWREKSAVRASMRRLTPGFLRLSARGTTAGSG